MAGFLVFHLKEFMMAGTKAGAAKTRAKILAKNPDFYKSIGAKGGRGSNNGGFASKKKGKDGLTGPERARVQGRRGGSLSRRGKAATE